MQALQQGFIHTFNEKMAVAAAQEGAVACLWCVQGVGRHAGLQLSVEAVSAQDGQHQGTFVVFFGQFAALNPVSGFLQIVVSEALVAEEVGKAVMRQCGKRMVDSGAFALHIAQDKGKFVSPMCADAQFAVIVRARQDAPAFSAIRQVGAVFGG